MAITYTDSQQLAINHRAGNLQIIACAGSGKTEVISKRTALIIDEGVPRESIICFTFTEKAAREMKTRIRKHLEEISPENPSIGDMYIGTIHSFCLQLLKEIDPKYRTFEILDETKQVAFISSNFYNIGLHRLQPLTSTGGYWATVREFISTLNILHVEDIDIDELQNDDLKNSVKQYKELLSSKPNYFIDFNDIVDHLTNTLKNNSAKLADVRERFKYLIVDEYQDIDPKQEELIMLLSDSGKQMYVTVVGDDDQSIYGWRGADISNILNFKNKYPDVKQIKLTENFRSTHAVIEIANSAIRRLPQGRRLPKSMIASEWVDGEDGTVLKEKMAELGDVQKRIFETPEEEAEWTARRISSLRGVIITEKNGEKRAIDYSDIAILIRSVRSNGRIFVETLRRAGIPVIVTGTRGLFSNDEVLLIQAAFCQLAEMEFLYTDIDGNNRNFNVDETRMFIRETINSLIEQNVMPYSDPNRFLEWIASKRTTIQRQNLPKEERGRLSRRIYIQEIFHEMLSILGSGNEQRQWGEDVLYNLGKVSSLITQYEAVHQWIKPSDIRSFCIFLGGWAAKNMDEGGPNEFLSPNAVQIMTIHGAKGLEWPVVFIPRVTSYHFPSSMRNRGPSTLLSEQEFDPARYAGGDDGERRLWYVALTRCRKFLNISSLDANRKRPTPFFNEISHDFAVTNGVDPTEREYGVPRPSEETTLLPTSFSELNYYWKCPYEYKLRCLMLFDPGISSSSIGYGDQIHNILAEVHDSAKGGVQVQEELIKELVLERFTLRYTSGKPFERLREAAGQTLIRYFNTYGIDGGLILYAEKPFEFIDKESGVLISGTIDLLEKVTKDNYGMEVREPVSLIDFKNHKWDNVNMYFERLHDVERQLLLYSNAARHALNLEPFKAVAHFLSPKPPIESLPDGEFSDRIKERVEVDVTEENLQTVRNEVASAVKGIKSKDFPMVGCTTGRCKKCDFRMICPGHTKWTKQQVSNTSLTFTEARENEEQDIIS
ncbi:DNA helicase-2/ATP-dependent DNA helicase PcrA [Bacillus sp. SORGH_AS 510]|uniref:ATP-dependent helicase n=1 Tax=Bacillus sp. SORGH_AS_0510 TaxID=3041771 RepID=UPI00277F59C5|nr:ATP-dependent DNA helicase [Bacillus sp. SORGH_AS_0510]MDQ1147033.1 DNA helicase-2/ATP-dependent DNA helicase PcrA [Bacillus sp. SORGH_AS_0510]